MMHSAAEKLHLGFLRVVATDAGYVGGILVTNRLGRPLEFQCTTPVKANRTQEILYGPTLRPFLFSELIGLTLIDRLQVKPDLALIDQEALLDLRTHVSLPIACLVEGGNVPDGVREGQEVVIGSQVVRCHSEHEGDMALLQQLATCIPSDADLREPLERVREALDETLRAGAAA